MRLNKIKIVILFSSCGLFFGLFTALSAFVTPYVIWIGAGIFFFLALATGFIIARVNNWFSFPKSNWQYITASLTIIIAYPLALAVMVLGITDSSDLNKGFRIGLVMAALVSAILVSKALKIITRKWDKQVVFMLLVGGIVTIPISAGIAGLMGISNAYLVLFPVGELIFGGLSGYWLQRAGNQAVSNQNAV